MRKTKQTNINTSTDTNTNTTANINTNREEKHETVAKASGQGMSAHQWEETFELRENTNTEAFLYVYTRDWSPIIFMGDN